MWCWCPDCAWSSSNKVCNQQSNNSSRRLYGCVGVAVLLPPIHGLNQKQTKTLCGISIKPRIVRTQYMHWYPIFWMQYLVQKQCLAILELIKKNIWNSEMFTIKLFPNQSVAFKLASYYLSSPYLEIYRQTFIFFYPGGRILASTRLLVIFFSVYLPAKHLIFHLKEL